MKCNFRGWLSAICLSVVSLAVRAETVRVELDCRGGERETYFLDLSAWKGRLSAFRLMDEAGRPVPFSFDARLGRPVVEGVWMCEPDGFYAKASAPASDDAFRQPGYVTFRAPAGTERCTLAFEVGEKDELPPSDPGLRPWWIELLRPGLAFKPGKGVRFEPRDIDGGRVRTAGRRLTALVRASSAGGGGRIHFGVALPNAMPRPPDALNFYFDVPEGTFDFVGEGCVRTGASAYTRRFAGDCGPTGPAEGLGIESASLQSAPGERVAGAAPLSDIWYCGDIIRFTVPQPKGEAMFASESGGVHFERAYAPKGPLGVRAELRRGTRRVAEGCGELRLDPSIGVGRYVLVTWLTDGDVRLARRETTIRVIGGAKWQD